MLDHCGAALDPVSAIVVSDAGELMDCRIVNVSAQNRVDPKFLGIANYRFLEFADEADRVLHPLLRVSAERPVAQAKSPADEIDRRIKGEQKLIPRIAQIREPPCILDDSVEFMSMNDENAPTISGDVNGMFLNGDIAVGTGEGADELVVISRDVNDRNSFARFAQDFLDHVVVLLRPIATASQLPDVDQIPDDVEFLAIVIAQKLKHRLGVARPCPEMKIGDPRCANAMERFRSGRRRFK